MCITEIVRRGRGADPEPRRFKSSKIIIPGIRTWAGLYLPGGDLPSIRGRVWTDGGNGYRLWNEFRVLTGAGSGNATVQRRGQFIDNAPSARTDRRAEEHYGAEHRERVCAGRENRTARQ